MDFVLCNRYLKTNLGTGGEKPSIFSKFISKLFSSNPDYDEKLHLVCIWYIEFEDFIPRREIGVELSAQPVLLGPDTSNYGFWLDTNMTYDDFSGELVSKDEFEEMWALATLLKHRMER